MARLLGVFGEMLLPMFMIGAGRYLEFGAIDLYKEFTLAFPDP